MILTFVMKFHRLYVHFIVDQISGGGWVPMATQGLSVVKCPLPSLSELQLRECCWGRADSPDSLLDKQPLCRLGGCREAFTPSLEARRREQVGIIG